ncbi:restriction endonuclease subunit S [Olleya sp. UBA1516]|uniref:restriction endonuclease subunit S n=1 Tax=Olleya sp. UBA1516 TaxID=1947013 RepID=UPI0025D2CD92|nr:restriction endonuclease subunit S [Olleya sp. UBA1516]|tara:strand:+ start:3192 stop:4367 length:1176 start_codon:yes stop_codon:yes gene_type:complete
MALLKDLIEKPITGEWGTDGEEINVLRTTNFTNSGVLDFTNVVKRNISKKKVEQKKLQEGDIIIEKSGGSPKQPVGRVVFYDVEGVYLCNNFTSILRPKKEKVVPKYLHYLLYASHRFGVTGMFQNKTTGIINLQLPRYINKLKIPLPPLKTQQRIATILDDAAALRDKTAQLLTEYDLLAESIFLEMFGDPVLNQKEWNIKRISDLSEKIQIGPFGSQLHQSDYKETGFSLVNPTDIDNGKIDLQKCRKISKHKFLSLPNYHLQIGDIIMARRGDLSKISVVNDDDLFCGTGSLYVRFIENLNPIFCYYFFNQEVTISRLYEKARGITMANLNKTIIKEFQIPVPPIELQNQFAEKIALIEQQKALAKQELRESEDLFNCLLQKAFKGEL